MKNNQGITLITLVVTIIVLLILAVISISAITADDGLVRRSQEAKFKMEATTYKEKEKSAKIPEGSIKEGDDIYALRERLTSQVNTLNQGTSNAENGRSMLTRVKDVLVEIESKTQNIKNCVINYSNTSNTTEDKTAIKDEVTKLIQEINEVVDTVEYNGIKVLSKTDKINIELGGENIEQGTIIIEFNDMTWKSLYGEDEIDYTNTETIEKIQNAITKVQNQISKIDAKKQRLEYSANYLNDLSKYITTIQNCISDVDMDEAIKNANSWNITIELINAAEGSLAQIQEILQNMMINAQQATLDYTEEKNIKSYSAIINELLDEVDRELNYCIVSNKKLLQGDLQYIEKIDINKLGIKNISVETKKDANKAVKSINDAVEYIKEVRQKVLNKQRSLESISRTKADEGYAFDVVDSVKKTETVDKSVDEIINSKFAIEGGILYYTGDDEQEKKWAQDLDIAIKQ